MKVDVLLCVIVVALSLFVPSLAFLNTAEGWSRSALESAESAGRYEQLAKDTESGKIKPDPTGLPAYLRMQAAGQIALADMFGNLGRSARSLLSASFGIATLQALLLAIVLVRARRRRARSERNET